MSAEALVTTLTAATSQDVTLIKQAEDQLKQWETNQGFYTTLLDIFLMKSLDINVRWMAVLCLKNGISKYWRRVGRNCISDTEKDLIRSKLVNCYDEEIIQLATQIAVIIGKIARIDIKQWPEIVLQTLEAVRSDHKLRCHRALLILNQIVKELASKRLITDRKVFQEISKEIFSHLAQKYEMYMSNIIQSRDMEQLKSDSEMCILLTKVIRKLLVYGATGYTSDSVQLKLVDSSLHAIPTLVSLRTNCRDQLCFDKIEKLTVLLLKVLSEFQEHHSFSYLPLLENTIQFCSQQILLSSSNVEFKTLVIYCANLLRTIMRSYKLPKEKTTEQDSIIVNANAIKRRIFTKDYIEKICDKLYTCYFPLTESDFEEWKGDPEGYVNVEAGESHKFLLRPCMETFYVGLFYENKNEVIPHLLRCIERINNAQPERTAVMEILQRCAIYKAVGLASYELFSDIDFDKWFQSKLIFLFQVDYQDPPILQQHVIWMIGEWINVKFSKQNRCILYDIVKHILSMPSVDLVLKLTTCKTLRSSMDDFDFVIDDFAPYVNNVFVPLSTLLIDVELCDTKMMVLNVVSVMIERIGDQVKCSAGKLLEHLPQLWELSEAHNLLRGAVINVLVHLVKGLKKESFCIHNITLPIIHYSTSVDQPAHVYLLEDGLELWLTVVRSSNKINDDLLALYKNMQKLFERASETLDICLSITKSYLFLDAATFLKDYGFGLNTVFSELFGNIKDDATSKISKILKLAFQLQPQGFLSVFQDCLTKVFTNIYTDENYPPLMVDFITIMANIVLRQPADFSILCEMSCKVVACSVEDFMNRILDIWIDKTDCMMLQDKKISALALSSLLPHKTKFIFDRFGLILDFCVNVLYDLQKKDNISGCPNDLLVVDIPSTQSKNNELDEDVKERMLLSKDPVYSVILLDFVREKLKEAKESYGEQLFKEVMDTLDPVVANQLMALIN